MQKLNNFIYMIAAAIVSNLVYAINGISAYAATCTYTHNSYFTDRRGHQSNLSSCSSACSRMWNGMADSWRAVYNSTNRSCTCMVTNRNTATGTAGMGESCMGSQNGAGPYMLVYSAPYSNSIKGCYIQGTGGFDKTGVFEYTQDSACYFR